MVDEMVMGEEMVEDGNNIKINHLPSIISSIISSYHFQLVLPI